MQRLIFYFYVSFRMADVNKLVFSIIRFLQDQKTNNSLDEEKVESIEGNLRMLLFLFNPYLMNGFSHHYQLDESTFIFRGRRCDFKILFHFLMKFL